MCMEYAQVIRGIFYTTQSLPKPKLPNLFAKVENVYAHIIMIINIIVLNLVNLNRNT